MPFIDWSRVATGVEKAGSRWSASIMQELAAGKEEARQRRMFTFRLGKETEARRELMEEGKVIAMDLERDKASLASELQANLGSLEVGSFITEASRPGDMGLQMQALGARDLIGRLQRFERPKPEDAQLLQSLPLNVQSPISAAMGAVSQYYQKEDREQERFRKWGAYTDAQTGHLKALVDVLNLKAGGEMTPEDARKLLDTSTKGLATLYKDDYFKVLMRKASRNEEMKPEETTAWKDYLLRYKVLHGSINAAGRILSGGATPPPLPTPEIEEEPAAKGKIAKAFTEGWFPEEGWMGNADRFVQDLIIKGYIGAEEGADKFMAWFKKVIQAVGKGEWEKQISY